MLRLVQFSRFWVCSSAIWARAAATSSALVFAWPPRPHPPSGASVRRTQVRSERGVTGRVRKEGREAANHGELLVTIEGTGVRETWTRT
jgi:hypothetical protein